MAAINTGRELAQSILRQPSPNEMVLFASNSLRVQKTIDAIRE